MKTFEFVIRLPLIGGNDKKNLLTQIYEAGLLADAVRKTELYEADFYLIISQLYDELIQDIIDAHIYDISPEDYAECLLPFDGGLLLIADDNQVIEPQCCSDITDYHGWQEILSDSLDNPKEWQLLWIGHPHIFYRFNGNNIELSDYEDRFENELLDKFKVKMCFDKTEFFQTLEKALAQLQVFKQKVYQVIDNGDYQNKEALKKSLID